MKQSLTVSLTEKVHSDLERLAKDEGLSKSQIVRNAIRDYVFAKKLMIFRSKMLANAPNGMFNNEDVFDR
jgi:metal-responsive CopG/Arc/MetJ family transcriptional regulator